MHSLSGWCSTSTLIATLCSDHLVLNMVIRTAHDCSSLTKHSLAMYKPLKGHLETFPQLGPILKGLQLTMLTNHCPALKHLHTRLGTITYPFPSRHLWVDMSRWLNPAFPQAPQLDDMWSFPTFSEDHLRTYTTYTLYVINNHGDRKNRNWDFFPFQNGLKIWLK